MQPRPFRFEAARAAQGAPRALPDSAGRRFKVLLQSRAPAQLSLFAPAPGERDSRTR